MGGGVDAGCLLIILCNNFERLSVWIESTVPVRINEIFETQ